MEHEYLYALAKLVAHAERAFIVYLSTSSVVVFSAIDLDVDVNMNLPDAFLINPLYPKYIIKEETQEEMWMEKTDGKKMRPGKCRSGRAYGIRFRGINGVY